MGQKRSKIKILSYENEIHRVNSPSNEHPQNTTFCEGDPNFGGGAVGKLRENGQNREMHYYAN